MVSPFPSPSSPLRMISGSPEVTWEEHLLPLSSYFEPKVKIITSKWQVAGWGGAMGNDVPSPLRHVLIYVSVTSFQFLVSMTSSSSEILSHRQLTVFKFEGFFLIGTKLENGVSLSASKQPLTVSLETYHLQLGVSEHPLFFFFFFFFASPCSMWDLSSLTRDRTCAPALEDRVLTTGPPGRLYPASSLSCFIHITCLVVFCARLYILRSQILFLFSHRLIPSA